MDGRRVVGAARTIAPDLVRCFVMMTRHASEADQEALATATGHPVLAKPIDVQVLRALVDGVATAGG